MEKKITKPLIEKELKEKLKNAKIIFAPSTQVDSAPNQKEKLIRAIGEFMGWEEEDLQHVFISDQSSLSDFNLEKEEIEELGAKLGFKVEGSDYITDIILKMRGVV